MFCCVILCKVVIWFRWEGHAGRWEVIRSLSRKTGDLFLVNMVFFCNVKLGPSLALEL
jgi:hypothetical protein